ncbi:MAG: O-antigen ligase family protein [Paeniclostridium sordellii]|nr:O-antigen ligase family protein [Paeniclostridium sordellii]
MSIYEENTNIVIGKERISITTLILGIFICSVFLCNDRYLGITEYYYIPIILIMFLSLYYLRHKIVVRIEHVFCILLIFYMCINLIRYNYSLDKGVYISYIAYLIMFLLLTMKNINAREIKFLLNCYIFASCIFSLYIIIFRRELDGWIGTYRYTVQLLNGVYIDPNFVGAFINISAVITFNRILAQKKKGLNAVLTAITAYATFLTGSRGAMIALLMGCGIAFASYNKLKIKRIMIGILFILIIGFLLYMVMPEGTLERMFIDSYYDGSNITRFTNWALGIKSFFMKPIFGYGFVNSVDILINSFGYGHAIHNTYIVTLSQFGIIGSIPIVLILVNLIIQIKKLNICVLYSILVPSLFTAIIIEQNLAINFWFILTILYLIKIFIEKNKNVDINQII